MIKNNMRPIHPGEILREEYLGPLGMSANALSIHLRIPATRVNEIARENRSVSPDTALRLARYFNTSAEYWLNLQSTYDLKLAEKEAGEKIEADIQPIAA